MIKFISKLTQKILHT